MAKNRENFIESMAVLLNFHALVEHLHSGRLLPYPQTLYLDGKACQRQMLQLLKKIHKSVIMVLSVIMLSVVAPAVVLNVVMLSAIILSFRGTIVLCWMGDMKKKTSLTVL